MSASARAPADPTSSPPSPGEPASPGRGARAALSLLLAINLTNYIDRYILSAVLPQIGEEFFGPGAASDENANAKLGLLSTAFLVSYMVAAPLFGWLGDRWRRWAIVGLGVIAWSLATGGSGLAHAYWIMLLCRVFVGIGEAAYGPVAPTIISDMYPVSRRGAVLAWFYVAIPVGSALGYVLGGQLSKLMGGWHGPFVVMTIPGIILGVMCFFMREPSRGAADAGATAPARKLAWRDYLVLARTPSLVLNTIGMTAMTFAVGGIAFWMPKYAYFRQYGEWAAATVDGVENAAVSAADHALRLERLAHINTIFGGITVVSGLAATLIGGYLADRLRTRFPGSYFLVAGIGLLVCFPATIASLYVPFPAAWALMFVAMFCLFLGTGPTNTVLANVTHPSMRASAYALNIFIIHALGDAISPPLMGVIKDRAGSWTPAFLLCAGMILLGGIAWLMGCKHLKRDTDAAATRVE